MSSLPNAGADHRRRTCIVSASVTLVVVLVAISVIGAWRTPGNEDFKAKWATGCGRTTQR